MTARTARTLAPAKVNLALHIGGRRPDGFHDLSTIFQAISLADHVSVTLGPSDGAVGLTVEGPDLGPIEQNLAWRAASRFREAAGESRRVDVVLSKRIPAGAGLGGGSSDAAAVLRCLQRLAGPLDPADLHAIGASLGSDVPFFLGGAPTAIAAGRGDELRPVRALGPRSLLLALPPVHVGTVDAYRALAASREGRVPPILPTLPEVFDWDEVVSSLAGNDFEDVVAPRHSEIAASLAALRGGGVEVALLSGSGAAAFGLLPEGRSGVSLVEALSAEYGWPFLEVRTLDAMPPVEAVGFD